MKMVAPRLAVTASYCALTAAFVLPDHSVAELQRPLHDGPQQVHEDHHSSWMPSGESLAAVFDDSVEDLASGIERAAKVFEDLQDQVHDQLSHVAGTIEDFVENINGGDHDFPDKTIYELISESKYTTKFAKLVNEHEDIVQLLNGTKANYTLFAPIDEAFEHIPEHHKKPSKEFIEELLYYHVGIGEYPARRILHTHTLPTAYDEKFLGGEPQRLRTSVGLGGVTVNFYSKVVATDIGAKNGVIHGVRSILVPPPMIGRVISLFPSSFSTLLLAYEKTDFVSYIHGVKMIGSTVFAPSNNAFARLGIKANAFLFNTETGLKYLKAILKYHIAPNATLYSDAFYDKTEHKGSDADLQGTEHFDLVTLLDKAHVGVDIANFAGFTTIRVNGFSHVTIADGLGKNGAIQVLDKVLLPPCKHKHGDKKHHHDHDHENAFATGEIGVSELKERLADYVE